MRDWADRVVDEVNDYCLWSHFTRSRCMLSKHEVASIWALLGLWLGQSWAIGIRRQSLQPEVITRFVGCHTYCVPLPLRLDMFAGHGRREPRRLR